MSHRLYAQKDQLEDEIKKLEASLKMKCNELSILSKSDIDRDLDMVKRMREILIVLRQEHQEIMNSIDRALESVARSCERPASGEPWMIRPPPPTNSLPQRQQTLSSASDIDSLVRRVQEAIGDDVPRSPEFRRYMGNYSPMGPEEPSPCDSGDSVCSEMSIASQQYLKKYGLMPPSPTQRARQRRGESFRPSRSSRLAQDTTIYEPVPPLHQPKQKSHRQTYGEDEIENYYPNLFTK